MSGGAGRLGVKLVWAVVCVLTVAVGFMWLGAGHSAEIKTDKEGYTHLMWFEKGLALLDSGKNGEAAEAFSKAIELQPEFATAYLFRGLANGEDETKLDSALSDFSKVIEMEPDNGDAFALRGAAYQRKGKFNEAIADYTRALSLNPNDAGSYSGRAAVYKKSGKFDLALADLKKASAIEPNNQEFRKEIAQIESEPKRAPKPPDKPGAAKEKSGCFIDTASWFN